MRYLIRYLQSGTADAAEYRDVDGNADEISIGSTPQQLIRLRSTQVAAQHARVVRGTGGQLQLRAIGDCTFEINGTSTTRAPLRPGDVVAIAGNTLTVLSVPPGFDVALAVARGDESAVPGYVVVEGARAGKRALSWMLFILLLAAGLGAPLLGYVSENTRDVLRKTALLPSDGLWQSGPLARGHLIDKIGANCNICHAHLFEPVQNGACKDCHRAVRAHTSLDHELARGLSNRRCATCHEEHNEPASIVRQDQAPCTDCHRDLKVQLSGKSAIENVTDFSGGHPDFRVTLALLTTVDGKTAWQTQRVRQGNEPLREQSHLKFSHKVHLAEKGVRGPDGRRVMKCADCHVEDDNGTHMRPVQMLPHCQECHVLNFDPCDAQAAAPHADAATVMLTVEGYYKRFGPKTCEVPAAPELDDELSLLPNAKRAPLPLARDAATAIQNAERLLFERSTCVICHEVQRTADARRATVWSVTPVRVNLAWMPGAVFSHRAHASSKCGDCHKAAASEKSTDVLMPDLKGCRECHGGESSRKKLASPCLKCHVFHRPGEPRLFETTSNPGVPGVPENGEQKS